MGIIKDRNSLEWVKLKAFCHTRIGELHKENEGDHSEVETARIRGMILLAREILNLEENEQKIVIPDTTYIE